MATKLDELLNQGQSPTFQLGGFATNPWVTLASQFGGGLLGGLGSLIGGDSPREKRASKTFNLAENRLGQSVLDPDQYMADYQRSLAPQFNQAAEGINRRLNLDSGVAQGALQEAIQPTLANFLLRAKMQNDILTSQRDNMLLSLMGSLGR